MSYDDLKEGDRLEHNWFWDSNILSWQPGKVVEWEKGQKVFLNDRHENVGTVILPHSMENFRPITTTNLKNE